jgi:hypothetical protein
MNPNGKTSKRKRPVARQNATKRRKNPQGALMKIERMEHPPQINGYEITHEKRLRFTVTAAVAAQVITYQNLLDLVLVATTAVAGFDLFDLVKVKAVEVWSAAALGTPTSCSVSFVTATVDRSVHTDTSLGVKPAHVSAVPNSQSLASFWQASAAGNAFVIQAPAGSIVDCTLCFRTASATPTAAQNALVAATPGEVYFRGLDGLAAAGTNFPSIPGVPNI